MLLFLPPATQSAMEFNHNRHRFCQCPCRGSIFQQKWGAFVQAFAARYGNAPNLCLCCNGWPGSAGGIVFLFTPKRYGLLHYTLGGLPNWNKVSKWIIDQIRNLLPKIRHSSWPWRTNSTTTGDNSLKTVVNLRIAQHPAITSA